MRHKKNKETQEDRGTRSKHGKKKKSWLVEEGNWQKLRSCCFSWVSTFKERNWILQLLPTLIQLSALSSGSHSVWWRDTVQMRVSTKSSLVPAKILGQAAGAKISHQILAAATCILPRPKYWRDSKSIPVVAAVGIKQLILEYLCCEHQSIALHQTLPPTGIHQTVYTHPIVTTVVMILSNFLSQKDMDSHSRFKVNNWHSQGQCHPNPHSFQYIPHQLTFNLYNLFVLPDVYIVLMT